MGEIEIEKGSVSKGWLDWLDVWTGLFGWTFRAVGCGLDGWTWWTVDLVDCGLAGLCLSR